MVIATPERTFAQKFRADSFARWKPMRLFRLADRRGAITYLPHAGKSAELNEGDTLAYRGTRTIPSILGDQTVELIFTRLHSDRDTFIYRSGATAEELGRRSELPLPFMVDLQQVERAAATLTGKELYTATDRWVSADGSDLKGRKFLKVKIESVDAANENYPYFISFISAESTNERGGLLMAYTVEEGIPALRGFENLFLLNDPRPNYPLISDEHWELIRSGVVITGMTSQEVRLALGSPNEIDRRADQSILYERWSYPGGVYLIFEDGLLSRTNL